jgi:hypothetical protein
MAATLHFAPVTGRESRPFERFDNGFLSSVAKDYHELPGEDGDSRSRVAPICGQVHGRAAA